MAHSEASSEREHLPFFVYGTLRPGEENYQLFAAGKTLREIPAVLLQHTMYAGRYPCVVEDAGAGEGEGGSRVIGDLLFIHPTLYEQVLAAFDALERFDPTHEDPWYRRVTRTVDYVAEDGSIRRSTAWVYLGGRATRATYTEADRVSSGDWFAYLRASGRK
jgi:gamma-glutamylcyclotransferase (GGCT)/AIG2-like uncharacterized protein YtfP